MLAASVGDGTTMTKIDFSKCVYWIQAPVGTRVEVRIESLQGYSVDGCIYGGVEIKAHADQLRTGYRFCSRASVGKTLVASSNLLPIITFNRFGRSTIGLAYRYVATFSPSSDIARVTAFVSGVDVLVPIANRDL
ncbi:hypothetical protein COOONC_17253 [Cooperia oncophora]